MSNFRSHKNESHTKESSQLEQSAQPPRDFADGINDITSASSLKEISLIETVTSFLEENGASDVDPKVLRNLAEALSKRVDDTSPGTLQDVTMDTSYNFAYRSHSGVGGHGATSPMVLGRSVRDLEEQMSALRKENFNLKLRIYFIEESMPGYKAASDSDGKETLAKQLIDAKIDNEVLRKELQEKQEILKEAAQAITQMENMQKDAEAKSQTTIAQLQERIQLLEKTNLLANSAGGGDGTTSAADKVATEIISSMEEKSRELGAALAKAEQKNKRLVDKICELEEKLQKTESSLVSCEEKIREQAIQNAELLEAADRKQEQILQIEQKMQENKEDLNKCLTDNKRLIAVVTAMHDSSSTSIHSLHDMTKVIQEQRQNIETLQVTIQCKTTAHMQLLERFVACEGTVSRQATELEMLKRENQLVHEILQDLKTQPTHINTVTCIELNQSNDESQLIMNAGRNRHTVPLSAADAKQKGILNIMTTQCRPIVPAITDRSQQYTRRMSPLQINEIDDAAVVAATPLPLKRSDSVSSVQSNFSGLSVLGNYANERPERPETRHRQPPSHVPLLPETNRIMGATRLPTTGFNIFRQLIARLSGSNSSHPL